MHPWIHPVPEPNRRLLRALRESQLTGGSVVQARTSSGSSGGGGFVVVGSSRRRRNQQSFDLEPSQRGILSEDALWSRILRQRRRRMNISRFSGRTSPF